MNCTNDLSAPPAADIVPGRGAAFVHLSTLVPAIEEKIEDAEEHLGADIIQKASTSRTSISNSPGVEGEVVVEKVKESEWEFSYNAMTDKYENLMESGVIDPAKVARCALQPHKLLSSKSLA
nr:RuBisCO large subunit-binding protein subunit alpha [Tanacetum cinerariifolium]